MSYISHVADSILAHQDNSGMLGPELYTAIAEWEKRDIPAGVVLCSIEELYQNAANGIEIPVEIFQAAVNRNFGLWLSGPGRQARAA